MKKALWICLCLSVVCVAWSQEARVIPITSFEEDPSWAYTSSSIVASYVDTSPTVDGVTAQDGEYLLYVEYDTTAGPWNWAQINFPIGALDLTGMREIHMWVYVVPGSQPHPTDNNYGIRLDLPGGANLGYRYVDTPGQWTELVWGIDRLTSESRIASVGNFGGFIMPGAEGVTGAMYIDNIWAVRPAGVPDVEQVMVYDFDVPDPATQAPLGWTQAEGRPPLIGAGDVPAAQGSNYMEMLLGGNWVRNVQTTDALNAYNRWAEVLEISVDVRVSTDYTGSWVQSALILQSGVNGPDGSPDPNVTNVSDWDGYPELGYGEATSDWKTILWAVDMSNHRGAFENPGGWFVISLTSNNDASQDGARIFFDNFQVSVPVGGGTPVHDWSVY